MFWNQIHSRWAKHWSILGTFKIPKIKIIINILSKNKKDVNYYPVDCSKLIFVC